MPAVNDHKQHQLERQRNYSWWQRDQNKFPGVRAASCHDDVTAEMSRRHNDANILCLSADLLGERLVTRMVEIWLTTEFEGGRHARRLEKITQYEHPVPPQA